MTLMETRRPYTEPYTLRERLMIRFTGAKYDWRAFWRNGLWQWIAHWLPRRIAYFAMIRVMAHAWAKAGNKTPNELTYEEVCRYWEQS
jgi:hypothetical protein